jgi:hypothetical protein
MSKTSKKLNREKRLQKKRARKAANKARYAELARTGQNKKSKRFLSNNRKRKTVKLIDHKDGPCGNLACKKCFPAMNRAA